MRAIWNWLIGDYIKKPKKEKYLFINDINTGILLEDITGITLMSLGDNKYNISVTNELKIKIWEE